MKAINALLTAVLFFTPAAFAKVEIYDGHVKPTFKRAFDSTGFWIIGSGLASTYLTQTQDYKMRDAWVHHQRMNESTADVGDFLGSGIPGVAIALTQLFLDEDNGIAHGEALAATALSTSLFKYTSGRARPSSDDHHSMPSGHTSTAFATATSLSYAYGWKAAVPSYALAGFVAASRWADDAHWFSDTVAGAFLGYFWGRATSSHHAKVYNGRWIPVLDSKMAGLIWHLEF